MHTSKEKQKFEGKKENLKKKNARREKICIHLLMNLLIKNKYLLSTCYEAGTVVAEMI